MLQYFVSKKMKFSWCMPTIARTQAVFSAHRHGDDNADFISGEATSSCL
jgi:hypothetical protein